MFLPQKVAEAKNLLHFSPFQGNIPPPLSNNHRRLCDRGLKKGGGTQDPQKDKFFVSALPTTIFGLVLQMLGQVTTSVPFVCAWWAMVEGDDGHDGGTQPDNAYFSILNNNHIQYP